MPKISSKAKSNINDDLNMNQDLYKNRGANMIKTVLFGMDDATASQFKKIFNESSDKLKPLNRSVQMLHSAKSALEELHPDIFLIVTNRILYDTGNHDDELVSNIFSIKSNPAFSDVRIAIVANTKSTDPVLARLAPVVHDIFLADPNSGDVDVAAIIWQLTNDETIQNVTQYLIKRDNNQNIDNSSHSNRNMKPISSPSPNARNKDADLEQAVKLYKQRLDMLEAENKGESVPRSDYDDLLKKARQLIDKGIDDENVKSLVGSIIDKNNALNNKLTDANRMIANQNDAIAKLTDDQRRSLDQRNHNYPPRRPQASSMPSSGKVPPQGGANATYRGQRNIPNGRTRNFRNSSVSNTPIEPSVKEDNKVYRGTKALVPSKMNTTQGSEKWYKKGPIIVTIGIAAFFLLIGGIVVKSNSDAAPTQTESSKPSFKSLISSGNYDKAAEYYPSKAIEAENEMLSNTDVNDKQSFAKKIQNVRDSDTLKFDNYFFEGNYQKCVDLLDNSSEENLKDLIQPRKVMAAYSYMKEGKIKKAEDQASGANNKDLDTKIKLYKKFSNSTDTLRKKIKDGGLSESEKDKAEKQIRKNQKNIDAL